MNVDRKHPQSSPTESDPQVLFQRLQQIHHAISSFEIPPSKPPIIDASTDSSLFLHNKSRSKEVLPGLRFLREEVRRDCETLRQVLDNSTSNGRGRPLSTNAPYLIAVWQELIHARHPIAIYRSFPLALPTPNAKVDEKKNTQHREPQSGRNSTSQDRMVKVDVVADNGARWIRVNTIKNSRLMMEFHEMDSYLASSDDDDDPEPGDTTRPRLAQPAFDNSVIKMGRDLLAAAHANTVATPATPSSGSDLSLAPAYVPRITLRLTRLNPYTNHHSDPTDSKGTLTDPRIPQTIDTLRELGVDVELGERPDPADPSQRQGPEGERPLLHDDVLVPTLRINLDLSALIALVSDITHSPVPGTSEEAHARFVPPNSYVEWKKERVRVLADVAKNCKGGQISGHVRDDLLKRHENHDCGNTVDHGMSTVENTGEGAAGEHDAQGSTQEISGQHSRALAVQAMQETNRPLLEEIRERLSVSCCCSSSHPSCLDSVLTADSTLMPSGTSLEGKANAQVQFWTTSEARDRCLQIVSKIGGKKEKQRTAALLGHEFGTVPVDEQISTLDHSPAKRVSSTPLDVAQRTRAYWEHSRYPPGFLPLVPVRVFESVLPREGAREQRNETPFTSLASTCRDILEREGISVSVTTPSSPFSHQNQILSEGSVWDPFQAFGSSNSEIPPVRHVHPSLKLTAHTLSSLITGASRGWTTLTTNRSSVKAVKGEMRRRGVDEGWGRRWEDQMEGNHAVERDHDCRRKFKTRRKAALWVVDPRSLAEGMRSDLDLEAEARGRRNN